MKIFKIKKMVLAVVAALVLYSTLSLLQSCSNNDWIENQSSDIMQLSKNIDSEQKRVVKLAEDSLFIKASNKIDMLGNEILNKYSKLSSEKKAELMELFEKSKNETDGSEITRLSQEINSILNIDNKKFKVIHKLVLDCRQSDNFNNIDKKTIIKASILRKLNSLNYQKAGRLKTNSIEPITFTLDPDCVNSCRSSYFVTVFACCFLPPPADLICLVGADIAYEYCLIPCRKYN